jgi:hypothetical protein
LKKLKRQPFDYFKGFYGDTALAQSARPNGLRLVVLRADHVLFASVARSTRKRAGLHPLHHRGDRSLDLSQADREKICHKNAETMSGCGRAETPDGGACRNNLLRFPLSSVVPVRRLPSQEHLSVAGLCSRRQVIRPCPGTCASLSGSVGSTSEPTPDEQKAVEEALGIQLRLPEGRQVSDFHPGAFERRRHHPPRIAARRLDLRRPQLLTVQFIQTEARSSRSPKERPAVSRGWHGNATTAFRWFERRLLVLLDLIIECATDLLDRVGDDLERINRALFQHHATAKRRHADRSLAAPAHISST